MCTLVTSLLLLVLISWRTLVAALSLPSNTVQSGRVIHPHRLQGQDLTKREYLIAPRERQGATAWVERRPDLPLPRMCIVATDPPMTDETISEFIKFTDEALALDEPFSVFWDISKPGCASPSRKQFQQVIGWMNADGHAETYDKAVQGHAFVVKGPLLRATIQLLTRIANPPQPILAVTDQDEALAFARDKLLGSLSDLSKQHAREEGRSECNSDRKAVGLHSLAAV